MKAGTKGRVGLLATIGLLMAAVGVLPIFGSTAYTAGLSLNETAVLTQFTIPGVPIGKLASPLDATSQPPVMLTLADPVAGLFPLSGQLLLDKTELVLYSTSGGAGCGALAANQVCVTQRAVVGDAKDHPGGAQVKLATQLTKKVPLPTSGPKTDASAANAGATTTLTTKIAQAAAPPFTIGITNGGNFPNKGFITVSHQATVLGVGTGEYFQYDNNQPNQCGAPKPAPGPSTLCIVARAQQPNNQAYQHPADGFPQPGPQPGRSHVDLHFQIEVKSNADFFPAGNLIVYRVDANNQIIEAELMGHNNAVGFKTPPSNEFHMTSRRAAASTFKKTATVAHPVNSIVTGPDDFWVCRNRNRQPGGFTEPVAGDGHTGTNHTQVPGTSVAVFAVCYTQSEPNGPPKPGGTGPGGLDVPIVGSPLILLNFFGDPFLSTGGFTHPIFGDVPHVDENGTKDGVSNLVSPCIIDFTPGTNLQINVSLSAAAEGIKLVLDSIHDAIANSGDECDDPAGTSHITVSIYAFPDDPNSADDDTDADGCADLRELQPDPGDGGLRDPWNPYDYYDVNHDGAINIFDDILEIAARFGTTPAGDEEFDRGTSYGPFDRNRSAPNGVINIFDDILVAAGQFGNFCPHDHTDYAPTGTIQWIFGDHP